MKLFVGMLLFISVTARAQHMSDTLNYAGGFNMLSSYLLKYLVHHDMDVKSSTFYIAEIAFDENCKISDISLFVTGDTSFNSVVIRAISSTQKNWSSTSSHTWRLTLPIYVFKNDENGWHPKAPDVASEYAVFNPRKSADRKIRLQPVEITVTTHDRETTSSKYSK